MTFLLTIAAFVLGMFAMTAAAVYEETKRPVYAGWGLVILIVALGLAYSAGARG